ncbi:MAG TPA: hypothetical protein PKA82_17810 [Pyrinomonadaceae bacterium]|nr:hypothetical protein [Pyrinomonadaceae bacterium]
MRFSNENEIAEVVRTFEDATISRDDWKHAEHLTVALQYLIEDDLETATTKMRDGIFKLLGAFGVDLTKEMPYHETLTVFWMRTVAEFNESTSGASLLEKANDLVERFDKDHPLKFYSREYLFSDEARSRFVEPDLQKLPSVISIQVS